MTAAPADDDSTALLQKAWPLALNLIARKLSSVTFETWVRPTQPLSYDGVTATLGVSSPFACEWLEKKAATAIQNALAFHLDTNSVELRFVVMNRADKPAAERKRARGAASNQPELSLDIPAETAVDISSAVTTPKRGAARTRSAPTLPQLPLNERYVFDNFIIGRNNRLAQAGSWAVAEKPGESYNPLFLYGGPGLGKTHLLHAIAHHLRGHHPNLQIAYVSGENFAQRYIAAIRDRTTEEFRKQYRHVDVWLVDDVQFIAGKEHTKEEFFHTFNTLYQSGKQIVIASDRSPRELNTLDERLRTRFQSGLIADIQPPEHATRFLILQECCKRDRISVPDELLEYIAGAIQSNVRALEGAVTKLVAYSSVMQAEVTPDMAHSVLGEYFIEKPVRTRRVTVEEVLAAIAEHFGMAADALTGQMRNKDIALARHVAMYVCRELLPHMNTVELGAAFGGRDHATVLYACRKVHTLMSADQELGTHVRGLIKTLAT